MCRGVRWGGSGLRHVEKRAAAVVNGQPTRTNECGRGKGKKTRRGVKGHEKNSFFLSFFWLGKNTLRSLAQTSNHCGSGRRPQKRLSTSFFYPFGILFCTKKIIRSRFWWQSWTTSWLIYSCLLFHPGSSKHAGFALGCQLLRVAEIWASEYPFPLLPGFYETAVNYGTIVWAGLIREPCGSMAYDGSRALEQDFE